MSGQVIENEWAKGTTNMKFSRRQGWLFGAISLFGVPAAALYGGGLINGAYLGPLPADYYDDEPCFTPTVAVTSDSVTQLTEVQVNPRGVLDDGNPNTYLRCSSYANLTLVVCHVGLPDGRVATCSDRAGPPVLPDLDDRVYMVIDDASTNIERCDIVIEKTYGEANPACRVSGTGGSGGGTTGSGGASSTCNAANAAATLSTGQSTTIASNACVRLTVDPTWSSVNPLIQAQPGTGSYPVPFTATSCAGSSSGSLTGDWDQKYLIDGSETAANFGCDVFVKLGGTGSMVKFVYYN